MIILFIGRFQPLHRGHIDALSQIEADLSDHPEPHKIIIGIGSSQYSGTTDNPYSFAERKKMIESSLAEVKTDCEIIALPDIHDPGNWADYVKEIVGEFDIVYTGNELVKKLFMEKNCAVKQLKFRIMVTGTELRGMIKHNNLQWKKLVSRQAIKIIKQRTC